MDGAPVSVSATWGINPDLNYCRCGLVFQVEDSNGPLPMARFLGAVQFSANGALTVDDDLSGNYALK